MTSPEFVEVHAVGGTLMYALEANLIENPPPPPPPPEARTPWYSFEFPEWEDLDPAKPAGVHQVVNYNTSIDDVLPLYLGGASPGDFWDRNWMPTQTATTYTAAQDIGGVSRDRPAGRPPRGGSLQVFSVADIKDCIRAYQAAGINFVSMHITKIPHVGTRATDGILIPGTSLPHTHPVANGSTPQGLPPDPDPYEWRQFKWWLQAAYELNSGFKIALWADSQTGATGPTLRHDLAAINAATSLNTAQKAAATDAAYLKAANDTIAQYATLFNGAHASAIWTWNNRKVINPYFPDIAPNGQGLKTNPNNPRSVQFWSRVKTGLTSGGVAPFIWWMWQDGDWTQYIAQYAGIGDANGYFGQRDPTTVNGAGVLNRGGTAASAARGMLYGHPIYAQVVVPRGDTTGSTAFGYFWENLGPGLMDAGFRSLIETNAAMAMLNTGNDFPEGSNLMPSQKTLRGWLDLAAYWIAWFRTGIKRTIVRDVAYLIHRTQTAATVLTGRTGSGQSKKVLLQGNTAYSDRVWAVVDVATSATVAITVGSTTTTSTVAAGRSILSAGAGFGAVSVAILRGTEAAVTLQSRHSILSTDQWEDKNYYVSSSEEFHPDRPALFLNANPNAPLAGTWTRTFTEEFDGSAIDTDKWATNWFGGTNMNGYTKLSANVTVAGGMALLETKADGSGAILTSNPWNGGGIGDGYEVGMNEYVEARINFPGSSGTTLYNWPAFWINGQTWPANGEADIFEVLGGRATSNYHYQDTDGDHVANNSGPIAGSWANGFHTYGVHRKPGQNDVYWDGVLVRSYPTFDAGAPQYILLTTGPNGTPHVDTVQVDYVRAWRQA